MRALATTAIYTRVATNVIAGTPALPSRSLASLGDTARLRLGMRGAREVADVFRRHGAAYRETHVGHLSRGQRRVMGAIETCRWAALGGLVESNSATAAASFASPHRLQFLHSCRNDGWSFAKSPDVGVVSIQAYGIRGKSPANPR